MKNIHSLLSVAQLEDIKLTFDGMFRVKAGRGYINWLNKLVYIIVKEKRSSLTRLSVVFIRDCQRIYKANGMKFLVFYLKTSHVQLMQSMGKYVVRDSALISKVRVSKTKSGLPRLIPSDVRRRIRNGDKHLLQIYLSFFSLYRVLSFPSVTSLKTIIEPGKKISPKFIQEWDHAILFMMSSKRWTWEKFRKSVSNPKPFLISKSSPVLREFSVDNEKVDNISTSVLGILRSAVALVAHPTLWVKFKLFASTLYPENVLIKMMIACREKAWTLSFPLSHVHAPLGALGFKDEAAGKVRVFAMVDCWTQWFMKPLHDAIFRLLADFETDGTKDQLKPIKRLLDRGHTRFWSYDLSAATDRLPVLLQSRILNRLHNSELGEYWASVLIHRSYHLPKKSKENPRTYDQDYKSFVLYSVGQPMGALSSWAMLALTHHMMVALAAHRAGFAYGKFTDYAVLGDDIVIANGKVAREYLNICAEIGVKVGIHKSLISRNGVLEFAKRYFVNGIDCSAVPLVEIASATRSVSAVLEIGRKYNLSYPQLCSVLGAGYKALGRLTSYARDISPRWRHLGILYYSPWGIVKLSPFVWLNLKYFINLNSDNSEPDGYKSLMIRRFELLNRRIESLRGPLRGFTQGYKKNPCVYVYNQMMSWLKECSISIYSSITGEIYKPIVEIVDDLVLQFRRDLLNAEGVARGMIYGFGPKEDAVIQWNELRHGLSLVRRLSSPNKRMSTKIVSAAHIWDLWRIFPKKPKPLPYNIPPNAKTGIGFYVWDSP